jgi:hypothetical protein
MRTVKYTVCLLVVAGAIGWAATLSPVQAATDVQILSTADLSAFVGAHSCKSTTSSNAGCTECKKTGTNKSSKCTDGSDYTRRTCVTGDPDGCTMSGSLTCSSYTDTWNNEDCSGEHTRIMTGCHVTAASGDECTSE